MDTWFRKRNKFIRILLLIIPVINWIVELLVRWSSYLKKGGIRIFILCIFVTLPTGIIIGWLDLIWTLFANRLIADKK